MPRITIRLLGPFEVTVDDVPVTFAYAKVRALLAYLAVEGRRSHTRAELATLLWPDQSERSARGNLSQALTALRNALGDRSAAPALLLADAQRVEFDPHGVVDVDVRRFLAAVETSESHGHRSWRTCAGCAERLRRALALYRGAFLADVPVPDSAPFEEWAASYREGCMQRALSTLERLVERAQWRGDYVEALGYARRLVALEPLLEANQRATMRLLALHGETAAALAQYRQFHGLLAQELDAEPEADTTALFEQLRRGDTAGLRPPQPAIVAPAAPAPLVGRDAELEALYACLRDASGRCLTLTGAGGIGKTRLAIEAAHALRYDYEDGVCFIELAALSDASLVANAISRGLGVPERPVSVDRALREHLRAKQLLLVLDNFEHVVSAAPLIGELLAACPHLTVLVTSRAPLQIRAEQQMILDPLSDADAVRLFIQRAHAAGSTIAEDGADTTVYAAICRRLDRLPLAIELIAVRARTLAPLELLRRLEQPLDALARGPRDASARHQSLRQAIQWSYGLLAAGDQRVFRHLGVFAGGWDDAAAQAVLGTSIDVLAALGQLHQASLVRLEPDEVQTRFGMLETIREFALEQLTLCGEAAAARQRHAEYYLDLVTHADARLKTSEQPMWAEQLDREHDNALAALAWCSAAGRIDVGLRLGGALQNYWMARGLNSLGLRWLDRLLAQADESVPPDARIAALNSSGYLHLYHGDFARSRSYYEQSFVLAQHSEEEDGAATALNGLGMALWHLGDFPAARGCVEQAVALCLETGNRFELGRAYNTLGLVHQFSGTADEARVAYELALAIGREIGHITFAALVLMNLANLASQIGDYAAAKERYAEALAVHRELKNVRRTADTLLNMGQLHTHLGELEAALRLYAEAEQHYLAIDSRADLGYVHAGYGDIAFQQGAYEPARDYYQRALDVFRATGDQRQIGRALGYLGYTAVRAGRLSEAADLCAEALKLRRAIGHRPGMILSLDSGYIELALALGRPAVAARLLGAADAARAELGRPRAPIEARAAQQVETTLRRQLDDASFVSAVDQGRAMSLEQAAAYALDSLSSPDAQRPARLN